MAGIFDVKTIIILVIQFLTFFSIIIIKFNDMKHLKADFKWLEKTMNENKKELKEDIHDLRKETEEQGKQIAKLEGKLNNYER